MRDDLFLLLSEALGGGRMHKRASHGQALALEMNVTKGQVVVSYVNLHVLSKLHRIQISPNRRGRDSDVPKSLDRNHVPSTSGE